MAHYNTFLLINFSSINAGMQIFSLGDGAATIQLGNQVNEYLNRKVLAMQQWLNDNRFSGLKDSIASYASLTVYYDAFVIKQQHPATDSSFSWVETQLRKAFELSVVQEEATRTIRIPVCYDAVYAPDLDVMAAEKNMDCATLIGLHTATLYRVYMIGFLPGFAYMGTVDERLITARKPKPQPVVAGSVGVAGNQTGIYPLNSPGGWQIIGRTPLQLFDADASDPVLLKAGDQVQFYAISKDEFETTSKWP